MINMLDIAWLAGIFDGEGCVYVLNTKRQSKKSGNRVISSVGLNLANTSPQLVEKYISVLDTIGITPAVFSEPRYGTRTIYYVKVNRKHDALTLARIIVDFATSKQSELRMAIWYLERACKSRQHVASEQDKQVLKAITDVKHNVDIPASVKRLLS